MMRFISRKSLLALMTAAIAAGALVSSAAASDGGQAALDPFSDCEQVTVGDVIQKLCLNFGTRKVVSTAGTVTVAPYFSVSCPPRDDGRPSAVNCGVFGASVSTTGFALNPSGPRPQIIPPRTIYMPAGTVGTLYVGGGAFPVNTPEICIGPDADCPNLIAR